MAVRQWNNAMPQNGLSRQNLFTKPRSGNPMAPPQPQQRPQMSQMGNMMSQVPQIQPIGTMMSQVPQMGNMMSQVPQMGNMLGQAASGLNPAMLNPALAAASTISGIANSQAGMKVLDVALDAKKVKGLVSIAESVPGLGRLAGNRRLAQEKADAALINAQIKKLERELKELKEDLMALSQKNDTSGLKDIIMTDIKEKQLSIAALRQKMIGAGEISMKSVLLIAQVIVFVIFLTLVFIKIKVSNTYLVDVGVWLSGLITVGLAVYNIFDKSKNRLNDELKNE